MSRLVEKADKAKMPVCYRDLRTEVVYEPLHVLAIRLIIGIGPRAADEEDGWSRYSGVRTSSLSKNCFGDSEARGELRYAIAEISALNSLLVCSRP